MVIIRYEKKSLVRGAPVWRIAVYSLIAGVSGAAVFPACTAQRFFVVSFGPLLLLSFLFRLLFDKHPPHPRLLPNLLETQARHRYCAVVLCVLDLCDEIQALVLMACTRQAAFSCNDSVIIVGSGHQEGYGTVPTRYFSITALKRHRIRCPR